MITHGLIGYHNDKEMKNWIKNIIYSLIILTALFSVSYGVQYFTLHPTEHNDIHVFMEAAKGNYHAESNDAGWIYKDYLAIAFRPLLMFNETTAYIVFSFISTISFLIMAHLAMKGKYGWILVLGLIPIFKQALQSCTTSITLSLFLLNPITLLVAILFKPHFIVFGFIYAFLFYHRTHRSRTDNKDAQFITTATSIYNFKAK